jgi:hypothetical protein
MRLPITSLFVLAAALLGEMQAASAQSPTSYQWCARHFGDWMVGPTSCYFTSYQQCRAALSGNSGVCFQSPFCYQPPPDAPWRTRRHA